jgi:hypothetical protein
MKEATQLLKAVGEPDRHYLCFYPEKVDRTEVEGKPR